MVGKTMTKRQFLKLAALTAAGASVSCLPGKVSGWMPEDVDPGETSARSGTGSGSDPTPIPEILNINPPEKTQKLIFIHHSTGQAWLADNHGGLGLTLRDNNYFVSDTNYGWGPMYPGGGTIGDHTDIGNWYDWFLGPKRDTYLDALYKENGQHCEYSRLSSDPGGENTIVIFKSCYPNSAVGGNSDDEPESGNYSLTVSGIKGIYTDLLDYFATRLDKLFVVITSPSLVQKATNSQQAENARAVNTWLVKEWLVDYPYNNISVFDYYNVLTSNGGSPNKNDLDAAGGNHHRVRDGALEYAIDQAGNYNVYGSSQDDSHPNPAGDQKATGEFIPLLNAWMNRWHNA